MSALKALAYGFLKGPSYGTDASGQLSRMRYMTPRAAAYENGAHSLVRAALSSHCID
ncbi:hypothetical protein [Roseovarius nanhaiticus]|uniref:hypothetical protein n=1 Tax=Roseovarius nanhaiticus TaxID=573024 RepID=UPI002492AFDE|nr:hypothetical protein [Roseovarius nanhaiticus]